MSNDRSPAHRPWRPSGAPAPRRSLSGPNWRRGRASTATDPPRRSRSRRIILGVLAASACSVLAVWVLLWLRPLRPAGLYIVQAGYLDNLAIPPNALGLNVASNLASLRKPSGGLDGMVGPVDLVASTPWDEGLADVRESSVIVYMTGQAGGDSKRAFLYRDATGILGREEDQFDASGKLYLDTVIAGLARHASKRFLLVLDVAEAPSNVAMGMLRNDFDRRLVDLEGAIVRAGNVVVLASGPGGGRAWVSRTGSETVFGHFVVEGLSGFAERSGGRIDTRDLADYVARRVGEWSRRAMGEDHAPILLPKGRSALRFDLVMAPQVPRGDATEEAERGPIPPEWKDDWRARWANHGRLSEFIPEAYAPHLWRTYRDTLLRFDALTRSLVPSGTGESARQSLGARLREYEAKLEAARAIPLGSSRNSLAMAAAEGPGLSPSEGRFKEFQLWINRQAMGGAADAIGDRDRMAFHDLLIRRVASAGGPDDFREAMGALMRLSDPRGPRPAEGHFLAILLRDLPAGLAGRPEGRAVVARALEVRRLAERAALGVAEGDQTRSRSYAEQIAPLVDGPVKEGDRARRLAEDLLFASDPARWREAESGLIRARSKYREAEDLASRLRAALAARDRAFADLPYYSEWAARRPDPVPSRKDGLSVASLVGKIETTWDAAHELASLLGMDPKVKEIEDFTAKVLEGLAEVQKEFQAEAKARRDEKEPSRGFHRAILALLDTPFLDDTDLRKDAPKLREKLMERLAIHAVGARPPSPDREATVAAARAGRLALAALGRRWGDDGDSARVPAPPGQGPAPPLDRPESFGEIRRRLVPFEDGKVEDKEGGEALDRIGDQLGRARRLLRLAIKSKAGIGGQADLKEWPAALQDADRLGRTLDGAQAATPDEPTDHYRRRLLRRVLLAQANRAVDDHWFAEDDDPDLADDPDARPPYFRAAAESYLADVESIAQADKGPDGDLSRLRRELSGSGRLAIRGPRDPLIVTDESAIEPQYRVEAPAGPARGWEGRPVAWLVPDGGVCLRDEASGFGPGAEARRDVPIDLPPPADGEGLRAARLGPVDGRPAGLVGFPRVEQAARQPGSIRRPEVVRGGLRLEGRYRGQVLRRRTRVEIHPTPEILVTRGPAPPTGEVAVQADPALIARFGRNEGGALAVVLDCSGSMGPPTNGPSDAPSKYREVTAALRQLLGRVTRGTRVSIWVFGEAVGPTGNADSPEQTIVRVQGPTPWRPDDPAQLADVMRKVELVPRNESPIVEAMLRARHDLSSATGFKSMIVLTDGLDNCFDRQPARPGRPKADIEMALREAFTESDVEINIVGYKVEDAEDDIRKQFRAIKSFRRPGSFYAVRQAPALADALTAALRPTLGYSVQDVDNVAVRGTIELGDAPAEDPGFRGLDAGGYRLVVEAGARSERRLTIHNGDKLLVRLSEAGRGVAMRRVTWTDELIPRPPSASARDWKLSALKSQAGADGGLSLWASLERLLDPAETPLELIRPREVWMEVRPDAAGPAAPPFQQRWGRLHAFPAPSWDLEVPSWPGGLVEGRPARPRVGAFWNPDTEADTIASLTRADFDSIDEIRDRAVRTARGEVVIESVRLEEMPGGGGLRRLIVRAGYPRGERFWVRPIGLGPGWAEHRFYTTAGKYTGVFWPVTEDQVREALYGLGLVSVSDFCDRARARGFAIEDLAADFPSTGDRGPNGPGLVPEPPALRPLPGAPLR